jgi:hypothetical protein
MARAALVTVPDEGAAWIVRDALTSRGVTVEVEPAGAEHPYAANALARPMRVWVPAEELDRARSLLAALEEEIANDETELSAEALGAGEAQAAGAAASPRSGYWFLYFLSLFVIILIGGICYIANPHEIEGLGISPERWTFSSGWITAWASLALVVTHLFGRRRVGRTILLNVIVGLLTAAIALLLTQLP